MVKVILMLLKSLPTLQGTCILWPKDLIAKPARLVRSPGVEQHHLPPPNVTSTQQAECIESSPKQPLKDDLPSPVSNLPVGSNEDRIFNYGLQIMQMGVFLMQLDDTEREGDGQRMMRNWKLLMLFNRSRRRGKKYAFEAMRLITNCRALYTPKMAHRIIHGMFVNPKGKEGNNYANNLKQEHFVKDHKETLHDLRGNKTLQAVTRATSSTYSQVIIAKKG